ncbi:MAG: aminotransferase class V-fold PLP-dependent enzyme, partial [Clostridia bacterium]|nr:aminotransferase class V-fold PLP-dependent enzyme [Clostridia bacterium]
MIYLDNAATEKPERKYVNAAEKYLFEEYFNPSALYKSGYNLHLELKEARHNILTQIANENSFSLVFTSGGTEADNQAVFCGGRRGNVVTTFGEHSAIFSAVNELKQRGIEVRFANLNSDGSVNTEHLLSLVDEKTSLVSVIHVNNETGVVNDIFSIAEKVKEKNKYTLFHSDGVQAFGKISYKLTDKIDLYSINAHKIGGVKGCGALIKKKNLQIKPYVYGGGQEQGFRSGTENVFAVKCFEYAAVDRYFKLEENLKKVVGLNNTMRRLLDGGLFTVLSSENASPYILCVAAKGVRGETVLHEADDNGLIIGTGSACSSNQKKRYSRVILACGADNVTADGVLRLSFSPENTIDD